MKTTIHNILLPAFAGVLAAGMTACSDSESYSDLLRDETRAVNWYLARQHVETEIPADSVFQTGPDAPFYKMDEEGHLYMQVINPGSAVKPKKGDMVYFLYSAQNILQMEQTGNMDVPAVGNAINMPSVGPTSFEYGNNYLTSTLKYGTGIQVPLGYLGYDSEVNLVMKSYVGFTEANQGTCIPYLMNVRYFKAQY
ncbi:MAG: DUF4827 domain-containing protein [Muribaculaceae bacterium]|nr:DUF4827 domain-containing protein [Muribaculaceae bacterium]